MRTGGKPEKVGKKLKKLEDKNKKVKFSIERRLI